MHFKASCLQTQYRRQLTNAFLQKRKNDDDSQQKDILCVCVCLSVCMCVCVQDTLALTSNVFEVNGLSVGVEQLDDGVIVVPHSAADGGHFPLNHRHVVSCQILTFDFTTQAENTEAKNTFEMWNKHLCLDI